jgi:hypothetical protein
MMDMVGNIFQRAWKDSHTILRIDLRRALSYEGPTLQRRRVAPPISQEGYGMLPGASVSSGGPLYRGEYGNQEEYVATGPSKGWLGGIQGGGARLKLMQVILLFFLTANTLFCNLFLVLRDCKQVVIM